MRDGRHGAEWGWASLLLAATDLLCVFPALTLMTTLWGIRFRDLVPEVVAGAGFVAAAAAQIVAIAAVTFGVFDIRDARRTGRPGAIGMAGVLLGGIDMFAWAGVSLQWLQEVSFFR